MYVYNFIFNKQSFLMKINILGHNIYVLLFCLLKWLWSTIILINFSTTFGQMLKNNEY